MNKICFLTIALSFFLSSPVMAELKCDRLPNGMQLIVFGLTAIVIR